jgi:hypothetical protein
MEKAIVTFSRVYEIPIETIYDRLDLNIDNIEDGDITQEAEYIARDMLKDELIFDIDSSEDSFNAEVKLI